ncbi:MAG: DNA helicase RecQ [Planctomycetota bacterium]|nr:DNA helicase RecQ [Planctomycetota bacterium]
MTDTTAIDPADQARILETVRSYWGYDGLRPLQQQAIQASLARRDSVVVLPTGGGKSLCYQVPPLIAGRTDVVISPLISLMKDQVDGLRSVGYPAAALHSGLSPQERRDIEADLAAGKLRLVFTAPERMMNPWFLSTLQRLGVSAFSVDEAHCISHWGHDFRPEYRQLALLRQQFPDACFHAFTATATPRVRQDIADQLELRDPAVLVGEFDRPNLIFRILPQVDRDQQAVDILRRHEGEAAIVYCISRRDTEAMTARLKAAGIEAAYYHAGMDAGARRKTQEAFANETLDVVVATVAFGMGIDRSNVRCVLHTAMPKSIEHYQQEAGRAGRDGLEAECAMLYSPADVIRWESLMEKGAADADMPPGSLDAQLALLKQIQKLCASAECRHKSLTEYFGQTYSKPNCGACDICLGEVEGMEDSTVAAQKILSCVARTEQRFGVGHVVDVLLGADTDMVRRCGHEQLSTYGLFKGTNRKALQNMVYQLIDQGLLSRTPGDRPTVRLNPESMEVLRGKKQVRLMRPKAQTTTRTRAAEVAWEGVDRGLVEHLRKIRQDIAAERGAPPFLVFDDATLRELARIRPTTTERLRRVRGMGDKRVADLGELLIEVIDEYCGRNNLTRDAFAAAPAAAPAAPVSESQRRISAAREAAFALFDGGASLEKVAAEVDRAPSTTSQYLVEYIESRRPEQIEAWVPAEDYNLVLEALAEVNVHKVRPLYEHLNGAVTHEKIRLVLAHVRPAV